MSLQLRLVQLNPRRREYQSDLAVSYNNLGAILSDLAQWSDAERCFRDAIAIQQRLATAAPLVPAYRRDLAHSFNNLGLSQSSAHALTAAEASFRKALDIQSELAAQHPSDAGVLSSLGGIYNNLGVAQQSQQQWTKASNAFERAVTAQRQALEIAPRAAQYTAALSKHYYNQAQVLLKLDRAADAAQVVLQRRALWLHDAERLSRIAEELSAICKRLEPGPARRELTQEVLATLRAARDAGLGTGTSRELQSDKSLPATVNSTVPDPSTNDLCASAQAASDFCPSEID